MPVLTTLGAATAKAWGFLQQVAAAADPYFNYVTMLLTGNGTNGAQNNTFLDSSSNAFSITRNGNTTQGSFSPYGSLWSNSFNGTSTFGLSASSAYKLDSDFTIEGWVNSNPYTDNYQTVISIGNGYGGSNNIIIYFNRSDLQNKYKVTIDDVEIINGSITVAVGVWSHFALVRSGTSLKLYVNGALDTSTTKSGTVFSSNPIICIGAETTSSTNTRFNGYISNLRITNTVVYSTTFTPSTTPLTAVSGTQLLTCQSNRFIDNSSNASALTVNGTPSVQRFSPFNPTASYSTATIGGSGYFDGSGDYLETSSTQIIPSGDFSIDAWIYPVTSGNSVIVSQGTAGNSGRLSLYLSGTTLVFQIGGNDITTSYASINVGEWNYISVTRSGSSVTIYKNGASLDSGTLSGSIQNTTMKVNSDFNSQQGNCYISDLRISSSVRTYSSAPTSPITSDANTRFLENFTNAGIPDSAMMNDLETVGNAQVSTSVKKFGTGSIAFDGTGDYLKSSTTALIPSTGNFTVEAWVYPTSFNNYPVIVSQGTSGTTGRFLLGLDGNTSNLYMQISGSYGSFGTNSSLTLNAWNYVAVVRNGTTFTGYVNGTACGTTYTSSDAIQNTPTWVGVSWNTSELWIGYIDDLRITSGIARTITTPTTAFPTY